MSTAEFTVNITIAVPQEKVFDYVANLTRHGEWADNPVEIRTLTPDPIAAGSRYQSIAESHGVRFETELTVTEYAPSALFAFTGGDATGHFEHRFTFQTKNGRTLVERRVRFATTPLQWLAFVVLLYPVRLPSAKRTLTRLKSRLEQAV